jgi:capsular polysaccharide biosynthesis protein
VIDTRWRIEDEATDPEVAGTPRPLLTTWHVLLGALRRGWRTWVSLALAGGLAALGLLVVRPPGGVATATILLVHPDAGDNSAMATDVSLLETRAVATRVIGALGLDLSPDAFLSTVSAEPVTNQILEVSVTGPTDAAALKRADALVAGFLGFRSDQLRSLSGGLVSGYQKHVVELKAQLDDVTREYNGLSGNDAAARTRATDLLGQRTQISSEINSTERAIQDASFTTDAAISSTHVVDAAHPVPHSRLRAVVLYLASGVIVGAALGIGLVIFRTLTSDRARTRRDVSRALGVPVRASVRTVGAVTGRVASLTGSLRAGLAAALDRVSRLLRLRRRRPHSPTDGAEVLAHALERAVPRARRPRTAPAKSGKAAASAARARVSPPGVGLAAVDDPRAAAVVLLALAARLADRGQTVLLVDLSESGALGAADAAAASVFRPSGIPSLSRGPALPGAGAVIDLQEQDRLREASNDADVMLVLVEVDPGMDVDNLASWVDRVVPLVTAGRTPAELLTTIADVVHAAGIDLPFALMTGSDATDTTAGIPVPQEPVGEFESPRSAPVR